VQQSTLVVCLLGVAVSAYLTFEHFTSSATLACPDTGAVNCAKVTTSSYSTAFGVPVALWGLAYFLGLTALCLPGAWRSPSRFVRLARLGAVSIGTAFVIYLLWAELFRVNAICLWCTAVHLLALTLFALVVLGQAVTRTGDLR
jgi:uncharacterized membrane protein